MSLPSLIPKELIEKLEECRKKYLSGQPLDP